VLVYDLGGGTFDITAIEIRGSAIRVIATGGDHYLGGRNWDESVVLYLADKWMEETGSMDNPMDSRETQQDLLQKAETAKWTLSARQEATVMVVHEGQRVPVKLTREKFDELTAGFLERTIEFTKNTMEEASKRGYGHIDQILLVGGSTRMPQVRTRLEQEFSLPIQLLDPDEAVAKGAAIYAQKLLIDDKIKYELAQALNTAPEEVSIESAPTDVLEQATSKLLVRAACG
jgi:molecular chaperone DnaK (HSP70)